MAHHYCPFGPEPKPWQQQPWQQLHRAKLCLGQGLSGHRVHSQLLGALLPLAMPALALAADSKATALARILYEALLFLLAHPSLCARRVRAPGVQVGVQIGAAL